MVESSFTQGVAVGAGVVVGADEGAGVEGAGVSVGACVPKQSRNAKASIMPAPSFPWYPGFSASTLVAVS